jgi:hypothetical protein
MPVEPVFSISAGATQVEGRTATGPSFDTTLSQAVNRHSVTQPVGTIEPLTVGREQGAKLFSVSRATWDRWDSSGLLGPVGMKKAGRKLWLLSELREWAASRMPCRKEWLAIQAAKRNGRPQ